MGGSAPSHQARQGVFHSQWRGLMIVHIVLYGRGRMPCGVIAGLKRLRDQDFNNYLGASAQLLQMRV